MIDLISGKMAEHLRGVEASVAHERRRPVHDMNHDIILDMIHAGRRDTVLANVDAVVRKKM